MARKEQRVVAALVDRVREALDRLAGALDALVNGPQPVPQVIPVRQPTAEELRRQARRRRGR